jgi:hypothetical protein
MTINYGRMTAVECPSCGARLDRSITSGGRPALLVVGEITACFHCCAPLMFTGADPVSYRALTDEEVLALPSDMLQEIGRGRRSATFRASLLQAALDIAAEAEEGQPPPAWPPPKTAHQLICEEQINPLVRQITQICEQYKIPYVAAFQVSPSGDAVVSGMSTPDASAQIDLALAAVRGIVRVRPVTGAPGAGSMPAFLVTPVAPCDCSACTASRAAQQGWKRDGVTDDK